MAMKLGTENKRNVYILAVLGLVMVGVALYQFWPSSENTASPKAGRAPATRTTAVRTVPATTADHEAAKVGRVGNNLDPTLHPEWMEQAESITYTGNGRNIFSLNSVPVDIPKPVKPARVEPVVATGPPPPPPPPPIDLKFFGYSSRQGGVRRAFLIKGDDIFIASEGDVVDHRYKVTHIAPTSVQVEDIPYNNTQSLPLVQN